MRIIRGRYQRRQITAPTNLPVRPTTDMAKESLFNIIENHFDFEKIEGIPVLRNHITICRGYLFSPVYQMDYEITIDDRWSADSLYFDF